MNLPAVRPHRQMTFDEVSTDAEIKDAEYDLLNAAERLSELRRRQSLERPWRPSDNLTPEEVAYIEAPDHL